MGLAMNLPVVLYFSNHSCFSICYKSGRFAGFLSRIFLSKLTSSYEKWWGYLHSLCRIFSQVMFSSRVSKGALPEASSQRSTPSAQISTRSSYDDPSTISGGTQSMVPQKVCLLYRGEQVDHPKSDIFSTPNSTSIFQGFISLCIMYSLCIYLRDAITCLPQYAVYYSLYFPYVIKWCTLARKSLNKH